jgi:hypothetical protein
MADPSCWCRPGLVDSGLLSRAKALAPATVRTPPKSGRDDGCCSAVLAKPGPRRNRSVAPMLAGVRTCSKRKRWEDPCEHPTTLHGFNDVSSDLECTVEMFSHWPGGNIYLLGCN